MNYRHVYMLIIEHARKEALEGRRPLLKRERRNFNQLFEFHHILPRSLFPLWETKESNLIPLTPREHFFCHQLLTKIWPTESMIHALAEFMFRKDDFRKNSLKRVKITSKEYENFRKSFSECQSRLHKGYFNRLSEEQQKLAIEKWRESNKRTPEQREQLRLKRAEIKAKKPVELKEKEFQNRSLAVRASMQAKSEEQRKKDHGQSKGTFWWNNGKICIRSKNCPGKDFKKGRLKFNK